MADSPQEGKGQGPIGALFQQLGMLGTALKWYLLWIPLLAVTVNLVCVFWVWEPNGLMRLRAVLDQDLRYIDLSLGGAAPQNPIEFAVSTANSLYKSIFVITGIENMRYQYMNPPTSPATNTADIGDSLFRPLFIEAWPIIESMMLIVQMYGVRLAVLIMSMPVFALVAAVAMADGGMAWHLRRVGGARESADLYHQFKRLILLSFILVSGIYLVVPISYDPRLIVLPFAVTFGIAVRVSVAMYKKYL